MYANPMHSMPVYGQQHHPFLGFPIHYNPPTLGQDPGYYPHIAPGALVYPPGRAAYTGACQLQNPTECPVQNSGTPTIKKCSLDAIFDAKALRKAMEGIGTDETAIVNILTRRTNVQRQEIAEAFKATFDLKSELSGNLEEAVIALMIPRDEFLAKSLNEAMSGIGTNEQTLIDVLCTADNQEIRKINEAYSKLFKKSLEADLIDDTSGYFRKLLIALNTANRNETQIPDPDLATEDAQALFRAGEKRMGTSESTFIRTLSGRSFPQIRLMLPEYERISRNTLEKAIKKEFSGDIETGLLAVVKSARNRAKYFAERLHGSMAGLGTNDSELIFLVVTRSEIDMENIKKEYNKMYGRTLAQDISGDCSWYYKKVLLALVGGK